VRTVIVGDVHGCRDELCDLLDRVAVISSDRVYLVGDLVARGPDSRGVLAMVRQLGAVSVRGNHEAHLLKWRHERKEPPATHRALARELDDEDWTFLERLPHSVHVESHALCIVHGGVDPAHAIDNQREKTLLTLRTVERNGRDVLWGEVYDGPPHVAFGHHAMRGLQIHRWATGLDTGCVYGGALTALVLDAGEPVPLDERERRGHLVSVNARKKYYDPTPP
jgi:hypothetical protein